MGQEIDLLKIRDRESYEFALDFRGRRTGYRRRPY